MLHKIIGIADFFIPQSVAKNPKLQRLARRYQAVSRMQLIIVSNMIIFNIPLLLYGEPGRPLPFIILAIIASVSLGLMTMYYFQTFIIPLLIALLGSVGFMLYGMLMTGGISSPFVFMIMTLPIVSITFGEAIVAKTLYATIAFSFLTVFIFQYTGIPLTEQGVPFTSLEQAMSILGALSITIFGGLHAKSEINSVRNALKTAKEAAVQEARIDSLTKLCNHRAFIENGDKTIEKWVRNQGNKAYHSTRKLYMLMIDIDFFKNVNDSYGHSTGDLVLIEVAKSLKNTTRNFETIARLGGEEFAVLLECDNKKDALEAAERLRINVEQTQLMQGEKIISVTISIGICQWNVGEDLNALLKNADIALYTAKETGRNKVTFKKR